MPHSFLDEVLEQSQRIHELIRQSAEQLSTSGTGATHEPASSGPQRGIHGACDNHAAAESLLQEATDCLAAMNETLHNAIRDRNMTDHRLAAALEQEQGARNAALHDNLTGLPNRELFEDRLEHGIAQAKRHGWKLAVMFLDLDNFKVINDTYGHQAGDAVLRTVAMRLGHNVRTDDTVSRYGGDEFLYLLTPLQEQKDIEMIAAKVLKAIRVPCDVVVGDGLVQLCLSASIGISVFPKDGASAAELIRRADEAMYGAKQLGSGFAFAL